MFPNQLTFYFNYRISGDTSGGLQLFGLIGLIYGPIIFALTMVLLRLYTIEFKDFQERQDNS
ncbi:hypothetical protein KIV35_22685 [Enterobacter roggenkampii]|uniref:hypothetical protein n=1 Tax=Enterobacter roggenkampii TaxID=1812935 RepID=UPI001BCE1508|nr:hypothetical protein [Enterobacter roggenkampii]MBS7802758.1 hypothetical protein [Enterobacter roggenkampii]